MNDGTAFGLIASFCELLVANNIDINYWSSNYKRFEKEHVILQQALVMNRSFFKGWLDCHKFYKEVPSEYQSALVLAAPTEDHQREEEYDGEESTHRFTEEGRRDDRRD